MQDQGLHADSQNLHVLTTFISLGCGHTCCHKCLPSQPNHSVAATHPRFSASCFTAPLCSSLDESQEATWRASGQHLKLQWLSAPSAVLVVYKPVPAVFHSAVRVVAWLLQRGLVVWVEPEAHAELAPAVEQYLQGGTLPAASSTTTESGGGSGRSGNSAGISIPAGGGNGNAQVNGTGLAAAAGYSISGSGTKHSLGSATVLATNQLGVSSSSYGGGSLSSSVAALGSSPVGGASSGLGLHHASSASHLAGSQLSSCDSHDDSAAATMHGMPPPLRSQPALDVSRQLRTWPDPSACGCPPAVPPAVGHQLDMVITLGGDGTVLWTCGLFAAGPVPPLVSCMVWWLGTAHLFPMQSVQTIVESLRTPQPAAPPVLHRCPSPWARWAS